MKVLVSDFDGTLFASETDVIKNKEAIQKFRQRGNLFIIATGRRLDSLLKEVKKRELSFDYLICNDGAMIYDQKVQCIFRTDILPSCNQTIVDVIESFSSSFSWYLDTGTEYTRDVSKRANKIIVSFPNREEAQKLLIELEEKIKEIHGYISQNWLNLFSKSIEKSKAISLLSEYASFSLDQVFTIGDNINDIEMLKDYHGYVMRPSKDLLLDYPSVSSVFALIEELIKKG